MASPLFDRVYAKLVAGKNNAVAKLGGMEWREIEQGFVKGVDPKDLEKAKELGNAMEDIPVFKEDSPAHLERYVRHYFDSMASATAGLGGSFEKLYFLTGDGALPSIGGTGQAARYLYRLGLIVSHMEVARTLNKIVGGENLTEDEPPKEEPAKPEPPKEEQPPNMKGGGALFMEGRVPRFDDSGNVCFTDAFDRVYYLDDHGEPFYFDDQYRPFRLRFTRGVPRREYVVDDAILFTPRNPCHMHHAEWRRRFMVGGAPPEEEPPSVKTPAETDAKPKKPAVPKVIQRMMDDDKAAFKGDDSRDRRAVIVARWRLVFTRWLQAAMDGLGKEGWEGELLSMLTSKNPFS